MIVLKLLIAFGVIVILRILFPSIVSGFKRIFFIIIVAMTIFGAVIWYTS
jgi:hypothetical protein